MTTLKGYTSDNDRERERAALVGRIAAGLAHDLNGPIGIVLSFTELTKELVRSEDIAKSLSAESAAKIDEYLNLIETSARRARALTLDVWEFATLAPGSISEIDIESELRLAARLAAPALRNAGVEVPEQTTRTDSGEEPSGGPAITADPALCVEAFVGLMLESSVALPKGGQIGWTTARDSTGAVRIDFLAQGWDGPATAPWTVPKRMRALFEMQGGSLVSGQNPGEAVASLPGVGVAGRRNE